MTPLVALLRSEQAAVQKAAASVLQSLASGCQEDRNVIIAAGAVSQLNALLRSDQPAVQEVATRTLRTLGDSYCNLM